MKQLNFCIDIDGTVTEAYDWIPRANDYFKTSIAPEMVNDYEIHKALGVESELYDEFYGLYGEIMHEEARIRRGVKKVLDMLYQKHNIHFVTAREAKMKPVTEKWLAHHKLPMDSLSLLGSHNKVSKAMALSCDLFIEDRYENAVQLAGYGFNVLLIDCNYNQGYSYPGITRVNDWLEINDHLENFLLSSRFSQIAV
ncbi:5' nucleotidase, NT5C type [Acetobacterium bakii]|uniref:Nucleotidase n=1 Tax=Acetobacterium bakii TaxID=52689 RepID=A0A0L6TYX2_9FIRM|nr:nucleotidase [Acetobacterium bakii]KNZ41282.1 nucleotidase [Acetobacterium bakii]